MKYLLDTNIISEAIKPSPDPVILNKLQQHRFDIAICSPVWHELLFGFYRLPASNKREKLERYLYQVVHQLPILSYNVEAAEWFAQERAKLTRMGKMPPLIDGQIAAIAQTNHLILVTRNISDFQYFSEIHIDNWFDH